MNNQKLFSYTAICFVGNKILKYNEHLYNPKKLQSLQRFLERKKVPGYINYYDKKTGVYQYRYYLKF